jgi:hypothetical protein
MMNKPGGFAAKADALFHHFSGTARARYASAHTSRILAITNW